MLATPHLGCSSHTYISIPRTVERAISVGMQQTGKDLFRNNPKKNNDTNKNNSQSIIREMGLDSKYLKPLSFFRKRIAYANAFMTDFQVPTNTAAFLSEESLYPHRVVISDIDNSRSKNKKFIVASFETEKQESILESILYQKGIEMKEGSLFRKSEDYLLISNALDALGWKKVFVDVRDLIPFPKISIPSLTKISSDLCLKAKFDKALKHKFETVNQGDVVTFSSNELEKLLCPFSRDSIPLIPFGHTVMVANAKNAVYRKINKGGEIVVNHLAEEMITDMLKWSLDTSIE